MAKKKLVLQYSLESFTNSLSIEESFVGEKWPDPRILPVLSLWLGLPRKSTASDQTLQWILKALWLRLPANYILWVGSPLMEDLSGNLPWWPKFKPYADPLLYTSLSRRSFIDSRGVSY